jgi:integrase/recombinase XerD
MRRYGCPRSIIQELRGDAKKEAIDIYDHITQDELKENYLQFVPKLGIKT